MKQESLYNNLIQQKEMEDILTPREVSAILNRDVIFIRDVIAETGSNRIIMPQQYLLSSYLTFDSYTPVFKLSELSGVIIDHVEVWNYVDDFQVDTQENEDGDLCIKLIPQEAEEWDDGLSNNPESDGAVFVSIIIMDPPA